MLAARLRTRIEPAQPSFREGGALVQVFEMSKYLAKHISLWAPSLWTSHRNPASLCMIDSGSLSQALSQGALLQSPDWDAKFSEATLKIPLLVPRNPRPWTSLRVPELSLKGGRCRFESWTTFYINTGKGSDIAKATHLLASYLLEYD